MESRVRSNAIFCLASSLSGDPVTNPKVDFLIKYHGILIRVKFANSDDGTVHLNVRLGLAGFDEGMLSGWGQFNSEPS